MGATGFEPVTYSLIVAVVELLCSCTLLEKIKGWSWKVYK